ncbi:MAG: hypothetical protein LBD08_02460 [Treponema sp.]|nr:hypothetical protein [Treponema sp.]
MAVSANLSRNAAEETARTEAETCVRLLRQNEPGAFSAALRAGCIKPCGGAAIAALLESGLVIGKAGEPAQEPLIKSRDENGNTIYYGGIAFYCLPRTGRPVGKRRFTTPVNPDRMAAVSGSKYIQEPWPAD